MKKYIQPSINVYILSSQDVIVSSGTDKLVEYDTEFNIKDFIEG